MMKKNVLVIDDEVDIRNGIINIMNDDGYNVHSASNGEESLAIFEKNIIDLIILDVWLENSNFDGIDLLKKFKSLSSNVQIIIISGHGNIEMAVSAIRLGAYEFIEKPFSSEKLSITCKRALESIEIKNENIKLKNEKFYDYDFIGKSTKIIKIKQLIEKVSSTSSRIIIYGESGTGKDIVAKEIHKNSNFKDGPFVIINSTLMEPNGIEEDLFGLEDEKGTVKTGFFEKANNGTLFIDEIGEMPIQTQAKILRFLTDNSLIRVGGNSSVNINLRLICSSTKDLDALVESGDFRKDLFHRLNVVNINIPKLSDRIEDIDILIDYFSNLYSDKKSDNISSLYDYIKTNFINYHWPGNVRELRNIIERYYIIGEKALNKNSVELVSGFNSKNVISMPLKNARQVFEKDYLLSQIKRFNGNISKTASFIGMERSALHRKLKQLGILIDNR